jgi:prepilin-type N-terminal cleavage/methylation domain-containing protein
VKAKHTPWMAMQKHPANKSELGFTLIEILIVIALEVLVNTLSEVRLCDEVGK